jgi:hypothetical protein
MQKLQNLCDDTLKKLTHCGKGPADVKWVQGQDADGLWSCTWEQFAAAAAELEHDGGPEWVSIDLKVVGDGWWLERREHELYDEWVFRQAVVRPKRSLAPTALTLRGMRWEYDTPGDED